MTNDIRDRFLVALEVSRIAGRVSDELFHAAGTLWRCTDTLAATYRSDMKDLVGSEREPFTFAQAARDIRAARH